MLVALLLLAATPADFGTSRLVDAAHTHDWVRLAEDEEATLHWDRNFLSARTFDGVSYPLVLIRGIQVPPQKAGGYMDILSAVDCAGSRIGAFELVINNTDAGAPVRKSYPLPSFTEVPDIDEPGTQVMMRAICGEGWAP